MNTMSVSIAQSCLAVVVLLSIAQTGAICTDDCKAIGTCCDYTPSGVTEPKFYCCPWQQGVCCKNNSQCCLKGMVCVEEQSGDYSCAQDNGIIIHGVPFQFRHYPKRIPATNGIPITIARLH